MLQGNFNLKTSSNSQNKNQYSTQERVQDGLLNSANLSYVLYRVQIKV